MNTTNAQQDKSALRLRIANQYFTPLTAERAAKRARAMADAITNNLENAELSYEGLNSENVQNLLIYTTTAPDDAKTIVRDTLNKQRSMLGLSKKFEVTSFNKFAHDGQRVPVLSARQTGFTLTL